MPTGEKIKRWWVDHHGVAPGEGDGPETIDRWTAAKQLAEMAYSEPPEMTPLGVKALAERQPGLFYLACRLRQKVQPDPATDEMARLALWFEVDERSTAARQTLEAFLGAP